MMLMLKFLLTHVALLDYTLYSIHYTEIIYHSSIWCHLDEDSFPFESGSY